MTDTACTCDPDNARVHITNHRDGSATVTCPTCHAKFTMPPLVRGGQGRDGEPFNAVFMTLTILVLLLALVALGICVVPA